MNVVEANGKLLIPNDHRDLSLQSMNRTTVNLIRSENVVAKTISARGASKLFVTPYQENELMRMSDIRKNISDRGGAHKGVEQAMKRNKLNMCHLQSNMGFR